MTPDAPPTLLVCILHLRLIHYKAYAKDIQTVGGELWSPPFPWSLRLRASPVDLHYTLVAAMIEKVIGALWR